MNLSCPTATLISLELRSYAASDPLLVFKDWNARMIAEDGKTRHMILYVGADIMLPERLQGALECHVIRARGGSPARLFIRSDIKYSLFIFDEEEAEEWESLARSLKHRERVPVLRKSDDFSRLVCDVRQLLGV